MNLTHNYFELFSLPVSYDVDRKLLESRYLKMQQQFHPDRFAGKGETEKRLAVQTTSLLNQAYDALKSPLKRAAYLLELRGVNADQESHVTGDMEFLMRQMQLREALAEIADSPAPAAKLDGFRTDIEKDFLDLQAEFKSRLDASELDAAFDTLARMQFCHKLLAEAEFLEAELED